MLSRLLKRERRSLQHMSKIGLQKSAGNMVAWMEAILYPTSNKKYARYNATDKT